MEIFHQGRLSTHTYETMRIWEAQKLCAMRVAVGLALWQWDRRMLSRKRNQHTQSTRWVYSICNLNHSYIWWLCIFGNFAAFYILVWLRYVNLLGEIIEYDNLLTVSKKFVLQMNKEEMFLLMFYYQIRKKVKVILTRAMSCEGVWRMQR